MLPVCLRRVSVFEIDLLVRVLQIPDGTIMSHMINAAYVGKMLIFLKELLYHALTNRVHVAAKPAKMGRFAGMMRDVTIETAMM